MNLLFLNQYGPDDSSPTARLLRDLIEDATTHGHFVDSVSAGVDYRQRPTRGMKRWLRELGGLLRILRGAICIDRRPDVIISFSSPPLVNSIAALAAKWHGARLIHWALDLYPDLALALGELQPGPLAHGITALTHWAYRQTDTIVTLDTDMRDRLAQRWGVRAEIIAPWPPISHETKVEIKPTSNPTWLYSGNLGRAHEWETLLQIQKQIETQHPTLELVVHGGGAAWAQAQARARELGLKRCRWNDYVEESALLEGLLAADVLIATQRPEVRGMLWPSKLAVLLKLPRPILWIGPTDCDAANAVRTHANSAAFAPGQADAAAAWLLKNINENRATASQTTFTFTPNFQLALDQWRKLIEGSIHG